MSVFITSPPVAILIPNQIPVIQASPQFGPEKITGGFIWAVKFELPVPAINDGIIVQEIFQTQSGTDSAGVFSTKTAHWWEAWNVNRGSSTSGTQQTIATFIATKGLTAPSDPKFHDPFNDIFFDSKALGNVGNWIFLSSAAFYERPLPPDFVIANPHTGAGGLPSTTTRPPFWTGIGLFRALKFDFDFRASRGKSNATLKTIILRSGTVFGSNPDDASFRTHN
jgi:hypothetical protein